MKKIFYIPIPISLLLISSFSIADYVIRFDSFDKNSINFVEPSENGTWQSVQPKYSEWTNIGAPYQCVNWTPNPDSVISGETFTQTAVDCRQDQSRSIQEREQNGLTLAYRNIGEPTIENQTLYNQTDTRTSVGTKSSGYSHFRILIEENFGDSYSQMIEVELLNSSNQDLFDIYTPQRIQTNQSSAYTTSYRADMTIDNQFGNSKWTSAGGQQINAWVSYTFPENVNPVALTITNFTSTSESSRQPKTFQLQYSLDGSSWSTLKRFENISSWAANEKKTFSLE